MLQVQNIDAEERQSQAVSSTPAPAAPPRTGASWTFNLPPLVWLGIGVVAATVLQPVLGFLAGGPKRWQQAAMEQAMKQMMKQAAKGGRGMAPAFPGAMPGLGAVGAGGSNPFFPGMPTSPVPPTIDMKVPVSEPPTAPATPALSATKAPNPAAGPATLRPTVSKEYIPVRPKAAFVDVEPEPSAALPTPEPEEETVEPTVIEPPGVKPTAETASASGRGFGKPPLQQQQREAKPPPAAGAGSVLDMLRSPEMQKTLYPYLPEHMRNPQTFEFMLSNPETRAQLETMMSQQMQSVGSTDVHDMLKDMDSEKVGAQFEALGVSPEQMMQRVMSDPELAGMMTKPNVMAALMDMNKDPMAMFKYQNDPEVIKVFEKLAGLFPEAARGRQ